MHQKEPAVMNAKTARRTPGLSRRRFLYGALATVQIVPGYVLGLRGQTPPGGRLGIAGIGVGGMGRNNLKRCAEGNAIVALCDVDPNYAAKTFQEHPGARTYVDFREMLDKQKDIDAVVIATPDHTHAPIAMACMRAGKHVYVQKPLAHSVFEVRTMTEAARQHKVVTQMGNQGRSGDGARLVCEWIWGGAIGAVREVHAWTNRPVWPQSIEVPRPAETPPAPAGMDWDKWIGPAPYRPYHPAYHPGNWRAWCDFGTGSLGDLGCHILDCVVWAMKLKYPVSVEGCISTYWHDLWKKTEPKNENFPRSTIVRYGFPAREGMPAVDVTWWDGGMMPPDLRSLRKAARWAIPTAACCSSATRASSCAAATARARAFPPRPRCRPSIAPSPPWSASRRARTATRPTGSGHARAAAPRPRTLTSPALSPKWC